MARLHKSHQEMDLIRERDKEENHEMMRNILDRVSTRGINVQQSQPSQGTNAIQVIQEVRASATFTGISEIYFVPDLKGRGS